MLCTGAALSISASGIGLFTSLLIASLLLPLVVSLGLLRALWAYARLALLPIFLVYLIAWGGVIQGRPDVSGALGPGSGVMYAAEFSARLLILGELVIIIWRSIATQELLSFVASVSNSKMISVGVAVAIFTFQFLQFQVRLAIDAALARGAVRGGSLIGKIAVIPLILSNLWVAALRQAVRRATLKWVPQDTLGRGLLINAPYASSRLHSALMSLLALALFLLVLLNTLERG